MITNHFHLLVKTWLENLPLFMKHMTTHSYIEQNPVKADIVNKVGEYPCTLGSVILKKNKPVACANKSKLVEALFCENIQKMTGVPLDAEALQDLKH
ncbi:hypothetical protein [Sulfurovum sp.]|uniref:hypothetical protein n=2 Tax=Sulfurovum sp. TaxID=1969726 RepID=UPI002630B7BD|nr:hypothetical protein [Sulfurovum sp.]